MLGNVFYYEEKNEELIYKSIEGEEKTKKNIAYIAPEVYHNFILFSFFSKEVNMLVKDT